MGTRQLDVDPAEVDLQVRSELCVNCGGSMGSFKGQVLTESETETDPFFFAAGRIEGGDELLALHRARVLLVLERSLSFQFLQHEDVF